MRWTKNFKQMIIGIILCGVIPLWITGCADKELIRKSALHYFEQGNQSYALKDYQAAVWFYLRAINLDSETSEFYYNLGLTYYEIGNYEEAIESFERVKKMTPGFADTYYNMALAYNKLYQSEMANKHYNHYQSMLSARVAKQKYEEQQRESAKEVQDVSTKVQEEIGEKSQDQTNVGKNTSKGAKPSGRKVAKNERKKSPKVSK